MISYLRNSIFIKSIWVMMGFFLLNMSVDPRDPELRHVPEDLSINLQESIVEIMVEKVLGFENAIAEHDDNDTDDHNKKSNVKIDLTNQFSVDAREKPAVALKAKKEFPDFNTYLTHGFQKLDIPPPKI